MIDLGHEPAPQPRADANSKSRIPLWRRFTAFFALWFMTILAGIVLAAVLGMTALLVLFLLERAIAS